MLRLAMTMRVEEKLQRGVVLLFLLLVSVSFAAALESSSAAVVHSVYGQPSQRYTYALRFDGTTMQSLNMAVDNTAFEKLLIRPSRALGLVELTTYKLDNEPIARYVLPRRVYQYVTLAGEIGAADIAFAEVTFAIPSTWLAENGVSAGQMVLFHYQNGEWHELSTRVGSIAGGKQQYTAAIESGMGNFAIGVLESFEVRARQPVVKQADYVEENLTVATVAPSIEPQTQMPIAQTQQTDPMLLIGGSLGVIVLCVVGGIFVLRRKTVPVDPSFVEIKKDLQRLKSDVSEKPQSIVQNADDLLKKLERQYAAKHTLGTMDEAAYAIKAKIDMLSPRILRQVVEQYRKKGAKDYQIMAILNDSGFDQARIQEALTIAK